MLILDPPLDNSSSEMLRRDIEALVSQFEETGWARDPDRNWGFSTTAEIRRHHKLGDRQIYVRSSTSQ